MFRGWFPLTAGIATVACLMVIPPDFARWIAIGLLVLVVLTPAIGRRTQPSSTRRTSRVRGVRSGSR